MTDDAFTDERLFRRQRAVDGVPDLTKIPDIDNAGIALNLRTRFARDEIYTCCGTILVACNPFKRLSCFEADDVRRYTGKRFGGEPPHIFATAEAAFDNIRQHEGNQSVVISGESGSGKTETTKLILQYLTAVTNNPAWIEQQIMEANTVLEAFGNARTLRNNNSSRFGKFTQVCFSAECNITGCMIEDYLLEKSRISFQAEGERGYHVFYQLCATCRVSPDDKLRYMVEPVKSYRYLNQSSCVAIEGVDDGKMFDDLRRAMTVLDMTSDMQHEIFAALSSILLLGNLEFADLDGEAVDFTSSDTAILQKVCMLMKLDQAALKKALQFRQIVVRGTASDIPLKLRDAQANRDASAQTIYERLFKMMIAHMNQKTNPGGRIASFVGVLDIFGFENFKVNSFEQLCINYTNEKLHRYFNHYCFALEQAEYEAEGIVCAHFLWHDNQECLDLIDKPKMCVLSFLDEACTLKTSTDKDLIEKVHKNLPGVSPQYYVVPTDKAKVKSHFGIMHFAGLVLYDSDGFIQKNRNTQATLLNEALDKSTLQYIRRLAAGDATTGGGDNKSGPKTLQSHGQLFKEQLGNLHAVLSGTTPWYVRCIKTNSKQRPALWESEMVLEQLQYTGMLDVIQIRARGFPFKIPFTVFLDKYRCLAPRSLFGSGTSPADTTRAIMERFDHFRGEDWQVGHSKIFFRQVCYDPLEDMRRQVIYDASSLISATWRMYRARKEYLHLRYIALFVQFKTRRFLRLKYEWRMALAEKYLIAWIRGFRARVMYRAMKAEQDRKKVSKAQREANKKIKENLEIASQTAKDELEEAANAVAAAQAALEQATGARDALSEQQSSGAEVDEALATAEADVAEKRQALEQAEAEHATAHDVFMNAMQQLKKFGDNNLTLGPAAKGKGKFKPGAVVDNTFFFMDQGQLKQGKRDKEQIEGDPTLKEWALKNLRQNFCRRQHESVMSIDDMLMHSKEKMILQSMTTIPASLVEALALAPQCWQRLQLYLGGAYKKPATAHDFVCWILTQGRSHVVLRDELYVQLVRQLRLTFSKATREVLLRGWTLMRFFVSSFPASNALHKHLNAFLYYKDQEAQRGMLGGLPNTGAAAGATIGARRQTLAAAAEDQEYFKSPDNVIRHSPEWCRAAMKHIKLNGVRKHSPTLLEFQSVCACDDVPLTVYFLNGEKEILKVSASLTAQELITEMANNIKLEDTHGWSFFDVYDEHEDQIRGLEYVGDIISAWENEQKRVVATVLKDNPDLRVLTNADYERLCHVCEEPKAVAKSKSKSLVPAGFKGRKGKLLLGFERRRDPLELMAEIRPPLLVFKKRLFIKDKLRPKGPNEQCLLYAQAVHSVVTSQLPMPVKDLLQLGGLQARVELDSFGNFGITDLAAVTEALYGRVERFLSDRVLENYQLENKRDRAQWLALLAKRHRDVTEGWDKDQCRAEYLKLAMACPLFGSSLYPAVYVGHWCFPQAIEIDVHEHGVRFVHRTTKEELRSYPWTRLDTLALTSAADQAVTAGTPELESGFTDRIAFTLNRLASEDPLKLEQLECLFESSHARDIAQMISSYSPDKKHQQWMKSKDEEARKKRTLVTDTEKNALERQLALLRSVLFDQDLLNKHSSSMRTSSSSSPPPPPISSIYAHRKSMPRLSMINIDINVNELQLQSMRAELADSFWEFTRDAADRVVPLSALHPRPGMASKYTHDELKAHAERLFASIRIYAGIDSVGGFFLPSDKNMVPMVQACLSRCIESAPLCDEFFLQLARMTTRGRARASAREALQIWKLFCITCGVVAPHNDTVYDYIATHLQIVIFTGADEEARHARYCLRVLADSHTKRARVFPPSAIEQLCAANLNDVQTRVYFLDKQFQTYTHTPTTSMAELRQLVKTKIGLGNDGDSFALFEVFGRNMEREMQPKELVCDIIFKWEKFAESSKATEELHLTFKRGPLFGDLIRPSTRVEFYLALHQAIHDVMSGRFPITYKEAVYLAALRAQHAIGPFSKLQLGQGRYKWIVENYVPESLRGDPEIADDIAEQHERVKAMSDYDCDKAYLDTVISWPCYGAMLYEVEQTYTSSVARNLWLAVSVDGVSLIARGEKEPLMAYTYEDIISFSPSLRCLMIVVSSLNAGLKYVFQTSQASQIANLMTRYCEHIKTTGAPKRLPMNVGGSAQQEATIITVNERKNAFWRKESSRRGSQKLSFKGRENTEDIAARRERERQLRAERTKHFEKLILSTADEESSDDAPVRSAGKGVRFSDEAIAPSSKYGALAEENEHAPRPKPKSTTGYLDLAPESAPSSPAPVRAAAPQSLAAHSSKAAAAALIPSEEGQYPMASGPSEYPEPTFSELRGDAAAAAHAVVASEEIYDEEQFDFPANVDEPKDASELENLSVVTDLLKETSLSGSRQSNFSEPAAMLEPDDTSSLTGDAAIAAH